MSLITNEMLADFGREFEASTQGKWHKGLTTHHTVCDGQGRKAYPIAEFHHADDAQFCDVAHEFWPLLVAEVIGLRRQVEELRAERDCQRACLDNAVTLLTGIHSLLYPAPVTVPDGRTMVFRPKNLDPHEVLQELSDRIRALPDELERLRAESTPQPADQPTDPA